MKLHSHVSVSDLLTLELLELDLNSLQVPERWVPSLPAIKLFLQPLSLYLWLLSHPTDPLVGSMRSSQILYQDINWSYVKKDAPSPNECILFIFRCCICASVGDCPHPTFCRHLKDTSTHEQFTILGLLLILICFPLSPAKSFIGFFFFLCNCHFVQMSMNKQKCKWADTIFVVSWGCCQEHHCVSVAWEC